VNTRNSSGRTPLIWAVITDEPGALNALILAHADVNLKDVAGETALSSAKQYNHSAIETLRLAGARE
jgi:ankyrin repeat protein